MTDSPCRLLAWASAEQTERLRRVADVAAMSIVAVVPPASTGGSAIGLELGVAVRDDLRGAVRTDDYDAVLLLADDALTGDEQAALAACGRTVFATQPRPGSIADALADPATARIAHFIPRFRRSPGFRLAAEARESFGDLRCVTVAARGHAADGGLLARLYDAMDVIDHLCGSAEMIDAAIAAESGDIPDTLGALHGHVTLNMRFADQRCAAVTASDRAGRWFRGITLLGDAGCLRIDDHGFEWIDARGDTVDAGRHDGPLDPATLMGLHMRRIIDQLDAGDPPPDAARLLAICEAARLSGRTGQGELPRRMLEMLSRP